MTSIFDRTDRPAREYGERAPLAFAYGWTLGRRRRRRARPARPAIAFALVPALA